MSPIDFIKLYKGSLVPLYGCRESLLICSVLIFTFLLIVPGLTWILHDYCMSLIPAHYP